MPEHHPQDASSSMGRYALRYLPLLILALLLLPLRGILEHPPLIMTTQDQPLAASPFASGPALYGLTMLSAQDVWAVGGTFRAVSKPEEHMQHLAPVHGLILHYQNGSWLASALLPLPLLSISLSSSKDGWAVGYAGQLAHYNGQTWQASLAPSNAILCSVVMLSAQEGWAVGFGGVILRFHNHQWSSIVSPTNADLLSIKMVSAQEGWAVGSNGTILHYSQDHWQAFRNPTTLTLRSVSFLSAQEGWAVGDQGTILHYQDGVWSAVQWLPATGQTMGQVTLLDIAITSKHSGWIVGQPSMLTYHKEVWQAQTAQNMGPQLYTIVMDTPDDGWAAGAFNTIYHYQSGVWQAVTIN